MKYYIGRVAKAEKAVRDYANYRIIRRSPLTPIGCLYFLAGYDPNLTIGKCVDIVEKLRGEEVL